MAKSTICLILKNKEVIKIADVATRMNAISKQRPQILKEVVKLLLIYIYINQIVLRGDNIFESFICEKAIKIFDGLVKKSPGTSALSFEFKDNRGWFEKFKNRSGIYHISCISTWEMASSSKEAADKFVVDFSDMIKKESFLPQQVSNADETGLFLKKMPNKTYITKEEKLLPGCKPRKD